MITGWTYRDCSNRLRCLATLLRKARGLQEGPSGGASVASRPRKCLAQVMTAVHCALDGTPPPDFRPRHSEQLKGLAFLIAQSEYALEIDEQHVRAHLHRQVVPLVAFSVHTEEQVKQQTLFHLTRVAAPGTSRFASQRHEFSLRLPNRGWCVGRYSLLLLALFIPWTIEIGSLRLSPYRLVLLVMLIPCLRMWLAGKAGPKRKEDILVFMYSFWVSLSLFVNHGLGPSPAACGYHLRGNRGGLSCRSLLHPERG